MKKIAFVIKLLQKDNFHGGGEKLFFNLINRFCSSENYEIDIYCSKSDIKKIEGVNKIVIIDKNYDHLKPHTMEEFYAEVKKLTDKENYDYVISENITPPIDITFLQGHSLLNRLKRDKNLLESFFYNFRKVKKERMKFHKKWLCQEFRKIFVVSEVLKQDIIENYRISEEKISVIYPGVDIAEKISGKSTNNVFTFGLLAPGFKIKGGFVFLKALGILKKKSCNFRAKIIYPKYKKNLGVKLLVKLLNIEKNIEFLPYQQDIEEFYRSINVLVAPSVEDTFNLAVLEAMANKRPCIVSSNAGASEIITDGENGFVFNMKNGSAYNVAEKMIFCIENTEKLQNIGEKAFKTAKLFSWDNTFENFVEELKKL